MSNVWSSNNFDDEVPDYIQRLLLPLVSSPEFNLFHAEEGDSSSASQAITTDTVSDTVSVPNSDFVAEIIGKQGCKIKLLRAKTNTFVIIFYKFVLFL